MTRLTSYVSKANSEFRSSCDWINEIAKRAIVFSELHMQLTQMLDEMNDLTKNKRLDGEAKEKILNAIRRLDQFTRTVSCGEPMTILNSMDTDLQCHVKRFKNLIKKYRKPVIQL